MSLASLDNAICAAHNAAGQTLLDSPWLCSSGMIALQPFSHLGLSCLRLASA